LSFAAKDHNLEGPHPGPDSLFVPHLKGYEIWQRSCPPQGEGTFAYFCCRAKVWRLAAREPPVLPLAFQRNKPQQINDLLLFGYRLTGN